MSDKPMAVMKTLQACFDPCFHVGIQVRLTKSTSDVAEQSVFVQVGDHPVFENAREQLIDDDEQSRIAKDFRLENVRSERILVKHRRPSLILKPFAETFFKKSAWPGVEELALFI